MLDSSMFSDIEPAFENLHNTLEILDESCIGQMDDLQMQNIPEQGSLQNKSRVLISKTEDHVNLPSANFLSEISETQKTPAIFTKKSTEETLAIEGLEETEKWIKCKILQSS